MYLVARATWRSGCLHSCLKCFLWPSVCLGHVFPSRFFRALLCETVSCCTRLTPQGRVYLTSPLYQGIIHVTGSLVVDVSGQLDGIRALELPPKPPSGAGIPLYGVENVQEKKPDEQIFRIRNLIFQTTIWARRFHSFLIPFIFNLYVFLF
jgi:hypothetical protein